MFKNDKILMIYFLIIFLGIPFFIPTTVTGSMPVEKTLTGCVIEGRFFSVSFDFQTSKPVKAYPIRIWQNLDLASYEGNAVSMVGSLLPGDRFVLKEGGKPVIVKEKCESDNLAVIRKEFIMEYRAAGYKAAMQKNFDEALILVNRALDMDKTLCGTYIDRAQIYYLKGDFSSGETDVKTVKDGACIDPQGLNYLVLEEMGTNLVKSGKKAAAIELYKMGLGSCRSDMCRETMNKDILKAAGK
jgi:hypothetical protein